MISLPIDPHLPDLVRIVQQEGALVLTAPPGSGKTTRLPPALTDARKEGQVLLVQPRRLAAVAAATRIAEERGSRLGEEVGYRVRFESRDGPGTRLLAVTEGILLRRLQGDPFLTGVGAVVLDEFHERTLQGDLLLALLLEVRRSVRTDLALVVMSATLEGELLAAHLQAPLHALDVPGHAVTLEHLPRMERTPVPDQVARHADWLMPADRARGHALVFLSGMRDIRRTEQRLAPMAAARGRRLHVLHGSLDLATQKQVLAPSETPKIILCTNIAEASLTVDGVDTVLDSGWERLLQYDPGSGLDRLVTTRISQHSATQRAGRAGRQGPGRVLRLWSQAEHASLPQRRTPEILRVDLSALCLELAAWGSGQQAAPAFLDAPTARTLDRARDLLGTLGALDQEGRITPRGRRMHALPVAPRLARLILECANVGLGGDGAWLAAMLEGEDVLERDAAVEHGSSDLLNRLDRIQQAARLGFSNAALRNARLRPGAAHRIRRLQRDLLRHVDRSDGATTGDRETALLQALTASHPDRVVRCRKSDPTRGVLVGGRGVRIARHSAVNGEPWLVAHQLVDPPQDRGGDPTVLLGSVTQPEWLEELHPDRIQDLEETFFDEDRGRVRCTHQRRYGDLPLALPVDATPDEGRGRELLGEALAPRMESWLAGDKEASSWWARLRFLRRVSPDSGLPDGSLEDLARQIANWSRPDASLAQIQKQPLLKHLQAAVPYDQQRRLEELAPATLEVPSGSRIRLDYSQGDAPVLAARLQELFGWTETPTVAGGRVPVLLHILGPNHRPVQVTQDLKSFWNTAYHQVRKDLRARYPKHSWPEDPWSAEAVRGARRRKSRE